MRTLLALMLLTAPMAGQPVSRKKPPVQREPPFIRSLRTKARHGQARAQFDLGVCYRYGQGVAQDDAQAAIWYRKAAEQGYGKAQYNLGVCYDLGKGVAQDHEEAAAWYHKAADQGNAKAQYNLAVSYKFGQGVSQDWVEAYAWFDLAASQGESIAVESRDNLMELLRPEELQRGKAREQILLAEIQIPAEKPPRKKKRGSRG